MAFYRRHLPHLSNDDQPVFVTWRLYGSLPPNRHFEDSQISSGKEFAIFDRLLDEARMGPYYLKQPAIADMVVETIYYNADALHRYTLHAFAVMSNHVHLLISPRMALPQITKALKGFTAKRANQMLSTTGQPFWQEESYDRLVRNSTEFEMNQELH